MFIVFFLASSSFSIQGHTTREGGHSSFFFLDMRDFSQIMPLPMPPRSQFSYPQSPASFPPPMIHMLVFTAEFSRFDFSHPLPPTTQDMPEQTDRRTTKGAKASVDGRVCCVWIDVPRSEIHTTGDAANEGRGGKKKHHLPSKAGNN